MGKALTLKAHDRFAEMSLTYSSLSICLLKGQGIAMIQRAQPVSDQNVKAVSREANVPLPLDNCRVVMDDNDAEISSIGPTMWFLQTEHSVLNDYLDRINSAGNDKSIYATDMSDQIMCLEVTGENATTLFSKGCALDFRESAFPIGYSARSLLGQANVIFNHVDKDKFHLLLDVSLLSYLWRWLAEASREFKS